MALAIPFFYGCNEAATTEKTEVEAEVITNIEVIEPVAVDSIAVEMDQVKTEIDESAEKVDELLNEL